MDVQILPNKLKGSVNIPASKSITHRALICAALANGTSELKNITLSTDIEATINALKNLGAEFTLSNNNISVKGKANNIIKSMKINCCESGSTLRFLIPVAAALGINTEFIGNGRLPERPITPYLRELSKNNISFSYNNTMPFSISGQLNNGIYNLEGNISSQFITGLLFALPLLDGDSIINLTTPLESKPYVDMTLSCLKHFGIQIDEDINKYIIKGNQKYSSADILIEGDYSQAAFFYTANFLGNKIEINNLNPESQQGDKKIVEIINNLCYNKNSFTIDASDIPDLVPILGVLGTYCGGTSRIYGAQRLKIKESNRLESTAAAINALGGKITLAEDGLIIEHAELNGGITESFGDHRIAMSAAIAATICSNPVIIKNADSVAKSYPDFFKEYINLGGTVNVITLE